MFLVSLIPLTFSSSSLARIEDAHAKLESDMYEIRLHLKKSACLQTSNKPLCVGMTSITGRAVGASLALAFLRDSETQRPWSATGIDDWINAGKWWLQKV